MHFRERARRPNHHEPHGDELDALSQHHADDSRPAVPEGRAYVLPQHVTVGEEPVGEILVDDYDGARSA
jgi:hypothetical protein